MVIVTTPCQIMCIMLTYYAYSLQVIYSCSTQIILHFKYNFHFLRFQFVQILHEISEGLT